MNLSRYAAPVAALALLLPTVHVDPVEGQDRIALQIDAIFAEFDHPGSVGCAVGVAQGGEFLFKKGAGYANLDWDIAITPSTVFYMGSVSKQFTAAAIALLAHEGLLDLDDDVRQYLPEMPPRSPPVTIRQVVHHMSGVPDMYRVMGQNGLSTWDRFSREEALELLAQQELDFAPGERYSYSNGGYFLLSMIVERASGRSLREYTTEKIFRPLGMRDTHFHDDPVHTVKRRAMSYMPRGQGEQGVEGAYYQSYQGNFALPGAGGLYSTVEDLLQWERNFANNRLGGPAFAIRQGEHRGLTTWGHSGSYMGFKTSYVRYPEQDFAVWVLCNMGEIAPGEYGRRVAELFLEGAMAR
jgi:CubicO group peptidase (beta-lactamase class C family)